MKLLITLALTAVMLTGANAFAKERLVRCTLEVDGISYLEDKACVFRATDRNGSFSIGVSENPDFSASYFAYVTVENGVGTGYWNGPDADSHAHENLGTLKNQRNGCWSNSRAVVCAK